MRETSLRELRGLSGLKQAELAKKTSTDRATLSQIESGQVEVAARKVATIRRVLLRAIAKRAARLNAVVAGEGEHGRHGDKRLRSENPDTSQPEAA